MAVVDILDAGVDAEFRGFQQTGEPAILAVQDLALDQQSEALLESQVVRVRLRLLLLQGIEHAGEFEGVELFTGVLLEHGDSLSGSIQW